MPNNIHSNFRAFYPNGMGVKAESGFEKLGKKAEQFISRLPSRAAKLLQNIENFNPNKLSEMLGKLDAKLNKLNNKINNHTINEFGNIHGHVNGMLNELDGFVRKELSSLLKKLGLSSNMPNSAHAYPMHNPAYGYQRPSTSIKLPKIANQYGHTCKPTALANLDHYFADLHKVQNIPLYKNSKGIYENQLNNYADNSAPATSIRKIAKQHGSVQGEVLQSDQLREIAQDMGYSTKSLSPANTEEFTHHVASELQKGHPLLVCFSVSKGEENVPLGFPKIFSSDDGKKEHAGLITEFNARNNTVSIAHWGNTYQNIPIDFLYRSMNTLPDTRKQEIYKKTGSSLDQIRARNKFKYDLVDKNEVKNSRSNTLQASITPERNSGFKNRLFVITPDLSNKRWNTDSK